MKRPSQLVPGIGVLLVGSITIAASLPINTAAAQGREIPPPSETDLLITIDHRGTAGYHLVNWNRDGLYTGLRISLIRPRGEKVLWSVHHAETTERSTFLGYGREQYFGFHGGFAWHQKMLDAVLLTGIGIVRERTFREYHDEDMGKGHEVYYLRDRMNQRFLFDFQLGAYHRGEELNIGLGFSLATRSLNINFGFPLSLDVLKGW